MRGLSLDHADVGLPHGACGRQPRRHAIHQLDGADLLACPGVGDQFLDDRSVLAVRCAAIKLDQRVHFRSVAEASAAQLTDGPATELLVATDFGRAWNSDGRRVSLFPLARLRLVALDLGDLDLLACLGAFVDLVAGFLWRAWGG